MNKVIEKAFYFECLDHIEMKEETLFYEAPYMDFFDALFIDLSHSPSVNWLKGKNFIVDVAEEITDLDKNTRLHFASTGTSYHDWNLQKLYKDEKPLEKPREKGKKEKAKLYELLKMIKKLKKTGKKTGEKQERSRNFCGP